MSVIKPCSPKLGEQVKGSSESALRKNRKEFANLLFAGLAPVFRDFKRLRVLNAGRLRAIALLQSISPQFPYSAHGRSKPFLSLHGILGHFLELPLGPGLYIRRFHWLRYFGASSRIASAFGSQ